MRTMRGCAFGRGVQERTGGARGLPGPRGGGNGTAAAAGTRQTVGTGGHTRGRAAETGASGDAGSNGFAAVGTDAAETAPRQQPRTGLMVARSGQQGIRCGEVADEAAGRQQGGTEAEAG